MGPLLSCHVIIDFVSPTCYEASRNIVEAIKASEFPVELEFHPYFLNDDDLDELKEHEDYERVSKAASSFSSLHAHRLLVFAKQHASNRQADLVLAIMKAFHDDRKALEDFEVLLSASDSVSLPRPMTKKFLEMVDLATDDVKQEAEENAGPAGAPFTIFGRIGQPRRKIVFSGVQTLDTIRDALRNLASN